jgi:hypothetical protein
MVALLKPRPLVDILLPPSYPWKYLTDPLVLIKAAVDAVNGHGLGSTK